MHLSIHAVIAVRNCMKIFWTHYTPTYLACLAEEQQVTQCRISLILSSLVMHSATLLYWVIMFLRILNFHDLHYER